ncbi:MAG TPA: hypothetical protein VK013_09060 [Myxococcaceae bacterium]|nr:hypothetical protein [Myxococcaceae bacterium]
MKRDRFRHIEAPRPAREPVRPEGASPSAGRPIGSTPPPAPGRFAAVVSPRPPPPTQAPDALPATPDAGAADLPDALSEPERLPPDHPSLKAPDRSLFAMPQQQAPDAPPGLLSDALFAPPGTSVPSPTHARFNPAPPPIALDERDGDTLPFRRCADCGVDSNRFATSCLHCDADLNSPAQLAFQRQVAEEIRERQAREAEVAEAQRREAQARSESLTGARRAFHEQLAAQQRRKIENELDARGIGWSDHHSLGDLLLSLLPVRFRRPIKWGLIALAVLVGIWNFGIRSKLAAQTSGALYLLSFLPVATLFLFVPFSWFGSLSRGHRGRWW